MISSPGSYLQLKPSDYFHRQISAAFIDDPLGVKHRDQVGIENMMWSSDYPHTVSTWRHSQEIIARDFAGAPEDEQRTIVRANVIGLYNLDLAV